MSVVARPGTERSRRYYAPGDPETCWEWTGATTGRGFGAILHDGTMMQAHRVVYLDRVGPIPEGLTLDHLCRNKACVNPHHMEPVSIRENILRSTSPSAVNARKTHCPQGHAYDDENTYRDPIGRRFCRACMRAHQRRYAAQRKAAAQS